MATFGADHVGVQQLALVRGARPALGRLLLGLPPEPLTSLLPLLSAGRFGIDTIRRLVPGATALAERRGLAAQRRLTAALVGNERVSYVPYAEGSRQGEAAA